jgi:hypothetical protein
MHAPYDRTPKSDQSPFAKTGIGLLVLPAVVAVALVALVLFHPKTSVWIAEAVQAEFGGTGIAEDMPKELAAPSMQARTVRAD